MFVKGCPSNISFTSDEVRVALESWVNEKLMPQARIRAAKISINRSGHVELQGVVPVKGNDD